MHDRDLDISKYSYTAYRTLKKTLGEYDAVVECNELAVLEFIQSIEDEPAQQRIKFLSQKHRIPFHSVKIDIFSTRIRQYYIASVMQQLEQFLLSFQDEWKEYFSDEYWTPKVDGETIFDNVVKNTNVQFSAPIMHCINYYRLVRNYCAHTDRDEKKVERAYKKVSKSDLSFLNEMSLTQQPNSLNSISFSDFIILTNVVKHIAYNLCIGSKPSNERIAGILLERAKEDGGRAFKGIKKLKNNDSRYEQAMRRFAATHCGRLSSNDLGEVISKFKCLLA